jgi:hypothetical protein
VGISAPFARRVLCRRAARHWLVWLGLLLPLFAQAGDLVSIQVSEPYMDLHTGPGRGYPVFDVAERGETVEILKRRTSWFKVRTVRGHEGWVSLDDIKKAVMADGVKQDLRDAVLDDFLHQHWEAGFGAGRFDGDPAIAFHAGYRLTDNVTAELGLTQVSGNYTGTLLMSGNLVIQPYTDTRFSPYLTLGGGWFQNHNRASLVGTTGTISAAAGNAGLGLRIYLTRNFVLRLDYKEYVVLTSVEKNDRFDEELVGLSFFF